MNNGTFSPDIGPALRSYFKRTKLESTPYFQLMQIDAQSTIANLASEYRYHSISSIDIVDAYACLLQSACFSAERLQQWHDAIVVAIDSDSVPDLFYKLDKVKHLLAQLVVTVELAAPLEHPLSRLAIRDIEELFDRYPILVYATFDQWLKTTQLMSEDGATGAIVNAVDLYKLFQRYSPGIKLDVLSEVYEILHFICQSSWLELANCAVLEEPELEAEQEPEPDDLQADLQEALNEVFDLIEG